jgi:hypothetical protein
VTTHDSKAAIVGAEMLRRWRQNEPGWRNLGNDIRRVKCKKTFPSPDLGFWDEDNQWNIRCEFKPPKQSDKRDTVHTGLGQAVGYLHPGVGAQLTYQIAPKSLGGGFDSGSHLTTLFKQQIQGRIPVGLILYNPDDLTDIEMAVPVELDTITSKGKKSAFHSEDRYWAKWVDMSTVELHRILSLAFHCEEKESDRRMRWIMKIFWKWNLGSKPYLANRDPHIFWAPSMGEGQGWRTKTLNNGRPYPGKAIMKGSKLRAAAQRRVRDGVVTEQVAERALRARLLDYSSDGMMYKVTYKNYFMTLDHLQLWDADYKLTDEGMELFMVGRSHEPNSSMFIDAFARLMLTTGEHHQLIMDLVEFSSGKSFGGHKEAVAAFVKHYSALGYMRFNEPRSTGGSGGTLPLKYEMLIWGKLGLLDKIGGLLDGVEGDNYGWRDGFGFSFNHRRIGDLLSS